MKRLIVGTASVAVPIGIPHITRGQVQTISLQATVTAGGRVDAVWTEAVLVSLECCPGPAGVRHPHR